MKVLRMEPQDEISSSLIRRDTKELASTFSVFSTMGGHSRKVAMYRSGRELAQGTESLETLISGFAASRMMRNKYLLFET